MAFKSKLNKDSAISGSQNSSYINETGSYIGHFAEAEVVTYPTGTVGITFAFESDCGKSSNYLNIFVTGKDGKDLPGMDRLHAIQACMDVKKVEGEEQTIMKYSKKAGKQVPTKAEIIPALCGKKIGLVLQKELSTYNRKDQEKMVLYNVFDASTKQTAEEKLKDDPAKNIEIMLKTLTDYDKRDKNSNSGGNEAKQASSAESDFDDDIPF